MKQKLILSLIFAISALLSVPFILFVIGLFDGSFTSGHRMIFRHNEMIVPYMLIPSIVAFISAFMLVGFIKYDPRKKNNNRKSWILTSLLIVIVSLILWAIAMVFVFQNHERWGGFYLAFIAGTIFSWALYPLGLLAGYICWRVKTKASV